MADEIAGDRDLLKVRRGDYLPKRKFRTVDESNEKDGEVRRVAENNTPVTDKALLRLRMGF